MRLRERVEPSSLSVPLSPMQLFRREFRLLSTESPIQVDGPKAHPPFEGRRARLLRFPRRLKFSRRPSLEVVSGRHESPLTRHVPNLGFDVVQKIQTTGPA